MRRMMLGCAMLLSACIVQPITRAMAEVSEVRVAYGYSVGFLALAVMDHEKLVEKYAAADGLNVKFTRQHVADTATGMQALLSGSVDMLAGGAPTSIILWDRTQDRLKVTSIGALSNMPMMLNTRDPKIRTIRDFTSADRIAIPGVKTSIQAIVLQMAAERDFGPGHAYDLDKLTVSRSLAEGSAEMLSGAGDINSNFASADYSTRELNHPGIHTVLRSEDVLSGSATYNTISMPERFREDNPKVYAAFVKALEEANRIINTDKRRAAEIYKEASGTSLPVDEILRSISVPGLKFDRTPEGYMRYAEFLHEIGTIDHLPRSWKDLVAPDVRELPGS